MAKRVALAPKLDTAAAAALRDEVAALKDDDLVIDASKVEQIGALCLELLMSVAALWKQAGKSVTFDSPSEQFTHDLERLGLSTDKLLENAA